MWDRNLDSIGKRLTSHFEVLDRDCEIKELLKLPQSLNRVIRNNFKDIEEEDINKIIELCFLIYKNTKLKEDSFDIVTTSPSIYNITSRKTNLLVEELLERASESIVLTGYSISRFSNELLDKIIEKSKKGIKVSFYINDVEKHRKVIEKLMLFKGKYLEVYNFKDEEDKMRALHAKVILVDGKEGLISSSNLSYHGLIHNIEMGIHFKSKSKGRKIGEFFSLLKKKRLITRV